MSRQRSDNWIRLHVGGLPKEMSEDGLTNLVGQICEVRNVKVINPTDETKRFAFGFFNVPTANDVQKVTGRLDGYKLKDYTLRVNYANPRDNDTRRPPSDEASPRGPSPGARPKQPQMNNNTVQNRPVTPRTLENRYGKTVSKSPTSPQVNGTHNSGDEIRHKSTDMVPMSVTRNIHNARQQQGVGGKAIDGGSGILPSKGRGHVLQSMLSGKQAEPVGKVSSNTEASREHVNFYSERERSEDEESIMSYGEYVKMLNETGTGGYMQNIEQDEGSDGRVQDKKQDKGTSGLQNKRVQDNMQHRKGTDGRMQDKGQHKGSGSLQNEKMQDKMQYGKRSGGLQNEKMQDKGQHTGSGGLQNGKIQDKMQHGKGSRGLQNEKMQDKMQHGRVQDGNKLSKSMPLQNRPGDRKQQRNQHQQGNQHDKSQQGRGQMKSGRMQETRKFPRKEVVKNENIRGKQRGNVGIQNNNAKKHEQKRANEKTAENMPNSKPKHEIKDKSKAVVVKKKQYVLYDGDNNTEFVSVLEECSDGEEISQTRSPPRPFREVPETYPNPGPYMHPPPPPPYGYGPYPPPPPPWNGYYGYYPPRPTEIWRPARRPFHPEYHPGMPPRPRNPHQFGVMPFGRRYKSPFGSAHRTYGQTGPRFPPPSYFRYNQSGETVEITELCRTPSPIRGPSIVIEQEEGDVVMESCESSEAENAVTTDTQTQRVTGEKTKQPAGTSDIDGITDGIQGMTLRGHEKIQGKDTVDETEAEKIIQHWLETGEIIGGDDAKVPSDNIHSEPAKGHVTSPEVGEKTEGNGKPPNAGITPANIGGDGEKTGDTNPLSTDIASPKDEDGDKTKGDAKPQNDDVTSPKDDDGQKTKGDTKSPKVGEDGCITGGDGKPKHAGNTSTKAGDGGGITKKFDGKSLDTDISAPTITKDEPKTQETGVITPKIPQVSDGNKEVTKTDDKQVNAKVTSKVVPQPGASSNVPSKSPSPSKISKRTPCANCGGLGSLKCSKCKTPYCTKECQATHWPKHKTECKAISEGQTPTEAVQRQQAPPQPQQEVKKPSARAKSPLFASKPGYLPHPQASAVYGRFLAKDLPEATPEEQTLDVLVTAVENPGCLYVNLIQRTSCLPYIELKKLMKATYPGQPTAKELHFYLTQVGELCAAERKGEWHRAEILSVRSPEEGVDVMLVDFGECIRVPRNNLKKLKEEMVKLPKQGVKCFLAGIHPPEEAERWSARSRELLRARILRKECSVEFKGYDANKGHEIHLFASQGAQASVSDELISAQLADALATDATSRPSPQVAATAAVETPHVSILDSIAEGSKLNIKLTYFASMDLIYGHLAENSSQIAELQMTLNSPGVVSDSSRTYFLPACNQLVAALYTDKQWYRAKVKSITTPQQCSVMFVDYGNREVIAIKDCQVLPAQFEKVPYQSLGLVLAGVQRPQKGWDSDIDEAFKGWLGEGDVECMVVRKRDDYLEVEMFNPQSPEPNKSFNSILADAGFTSAEQEAAASEVNTPNKVQPEAISCSVVWVNDPSTFFIQKVDDQEVLITLAQELPACYNESANDNYTPAVGDLCAAVFDRFWCRGKVVECMGPISTKVFFLDFGNESVIENDKIRALKPQFKDIPPKAIVCGLDMVAPPSGQTEWSEQSIIKMKEMLENKSCTIHITRVTAGKKYVIAVQDNKEIHRELIKLKLAVEDVAKGTQVAQPTPVLTRLPEMEMPSGEFQALVIWLNNPSEIFIQIAVKENIEAFQSLSNGLHDHYEQLPTTSYKPQVGEICVTKTPDGWLRARVLAIEAPNGYRVQFIDYGNEDVIQGSVHKLDEEFAKYPAVACKCCLTGVSPASEGQWSQQAIEWLKKEILEQPVTVRQDQTNSITILKGDVNVGEQMIAVGYAKSVTTTPAPRAMSKPLATSPAPRAMSKPVTLNIIKPPTGEFKGQLVHINNPTDVFITIFRDEEVRAFQKLTIDLNTLCAKLGPSQSTLTTGDLCMAKYEGEWYRAKVTESHNEDVVKVLFVDFGNEEEVKRNNTHLLLERFAELPSMAVHCQLANVCPPGGGQTWSKEATAFIQHKVMNQVVFAKVVKASPTIYTITINIPQRDGPSLSLSQELIKTSLAKDPAQSPPRKEIKQQSPRPSQPKINQTPRPSPPKINQALLPSPPKTNQALLPSPPKINQAPQSSPPKTNQALLPSPPKINQAASPSTPKANQSSHVSSPNQPHGSGAQKLSIPAATTGRDFEGTVILVTHPNDFYISLRTTTKENEAAMHTLKNDLKEHYSSVPQTGYKPEIGDCVVAERKGLWGRAQVIGASGPNTAKLLFVDYGIKDNIEHDSIREIEARFAQLPRMAVHCGIANILSKGQNSRFWPPEVSNIVRERILKCPCKARVTGVSPKSGLHFVDLVVTMKNGKPLEVADEMVKYNLAISAKRTPQSPDAGVPNQALSPPHPMKSPQGRSPDTNHMPSTKGSPDANHMPSTRRSPDTNQMPSNKGAFQKYQKNQPAHVNSPDGSQQHSQRSPKPVVSQTPNNRPTGLPQIPKAQVPASKTVSGPVVWFNHPGSFYVQAIKEFGDELRSLLEALSRLSDNPQPGYTPTVGEFVMTKYENEWCRARVNSISGGTAKVMFYDYGNEETVPTNGLHQMPDSIGAMPVCTLHCAIAGIIPTGGKNWSEDVIQMIKPKVSDQLCQVEVIDNTGDICQVNLLVTHGDTTLDVKADLIKSGMAAQVSTTANPISTGRRTPDLAIKFPDQEVAGINRMARTNNDSHASCTLPAETTISLPKLPLLSSKFQAVVVFVNHPANFYIQIANEENAHAITKLGTDLNNYYSQPGRQSIKPKEGEMCVAQFSQDSGWYRAKVVGTASSDSAKVLFVDFGNEEAVNHDVIKKLSEEFHKVPVMAQQCCLANVQSPRDQGGQWSSSSDATAYMREQVMAGLCEIKVVDASATPVTVELVYGVQSENPTKLSEDLIKKNLARQGTASQPGAIPKPSPSTSQQRNPPSNGVTAKPQHDTQDSTRGSTAQIQQAQVPQGIFQGAISWVNTPQDLYIQPINDKNLAVMKILQEFSVHYAKAAITLPQHRPVIGSVCAALYADTGEWCRAVALEYTAKDKIKVLFADYGNTEVVGCNNVHKLDDKFIRDAPVMAFGCSLAGVTPVGNGWSKEAIQLVSQLLNKPCEIRVTGSREGIPGILVEVKPSDGITINQQLITKGLAQSMQNGAPSSPSPNNVSLLTASNLPGLRSVSRASADSCETDVDMLNARLTEKDRQIEMQQRTLAEHERQMEEQRRQMEEQKRQLETLTQMMAKIAK